MHRPLAFLPAALAEKCGDRPCVVIVRSQEEFQRWLSDPFPQTQWLQIEHLLQDPDAWTFASRGNSQIPIDVLLSEPSAEFSFLYRLVDVFRIRDVRVSILAEPGFLKAVKLATSLRFPVRVLPGQPTPSALTDLTCALELYLHDPAVEAPVEFFHSLLGNVCGTDTGSLWEILEEDPAVFLHYDGDGRPRLPRSAQVPDENTYLTTFVEKNLQSLIQQGAECANCPWQPACRGYFKWPDPSYSCTGVKRLFSLLSAAANEMSQDLAGSEPAASDDLKLKL
jgi:hypothetical protein